MSLFGIAMTHRFAIAIAAAAVAACPIAIDVRCEHDGHCSPGEVCRRGSCVPAFDGGPDDGADAGPADAGCAATVPLYQACSRACECATPGAQCEGFRCTLRCGTDFACPPDRRCDFDVCVVGKRLGARCTDHFECPGVARCEYGRCEETCGLCSNGYRCAPDRVCIEDCFGVPVTLGLTCYSSTDCARCGVCADAGALAMCHAQCFLDRDCPDGGPGACQPRGAYSTCRL